MTENNESHELKLFECEYLVELEDTLEKALIDLVEHTLPIQNRADTSWNIIRFELWNDTGRIIIFPAVKPFVERIDVCCCQIVCNEIRDIIQRATFSSISDEEYENIEKLLTSQLIGIIKKLAHKNLDCDYAIYLYGDEEVVKT